MFYFPDSRDLLEVLVGLPGGLLMVLQWLPGGFQWSSSATLSSTEDLNIDEDNIRAKHGIRTTRDLPEHLESSGW